MQIGRVLGSLGSLSRELLVYKWYVIIVLGLVIVSGKRLSQVVSQSKLLDRKLGAVFA